MSDNIVSLMCSREGGEKRGWGIDGFQGLTDAPVSTADRIPVARHPHIKFLPAFIALQLVEADDQVHPLQSPAQQCALYVCI